MLFRLPHEMFSLFRPPNRCRLLVGTPAIRFGNGDRLGCSISLLMPLRMKRGLFGMGMPLPVAVRRGVRRSDGMRPFIWSVVCGMPISVVAAMFWIGGRPD